MKISKKNIWNRKVIAFKSKDDWKDQRYSGIGGSDAATILGRNPYKSNLELWQEKLAKTDNVRVNIKMQYGIDAEEPLRMLFALNNPQYQVFYKKDSMVIHKEHPFLFASLDGSLLEVETGRKGVFEVKTTEILNSTMSADWKMGRDGEADNIPFHYYVQVLHSMAVTGADFARLFAQLKYDIDGKVFFSLRTYEIERDEVSDDIELIEKKEIHFWQENILKEVKPALILPAI